MNLFRRIFGSSRQSVVLGRADDDDAKPDEQKQEPQPDRVEPAREERSDEQ